MKIVISSGHGKHIRGAAGSPIPPCVDEVDEARKIVEATASELRKLGVETTTYHDDVSTTQSENLGRIVDFHNSRSRDLDVSVHLNCYNKSAHGVEVLYVSQQALAAEVSAAIAKNGFTDRGAKKRTDLAFLNNTNKPAVLVETFFCDNTADCNRYHAAFAAICRSIATSLAGEQAAPIEPPEAERPPWVEPPTPDARRTIAKGDNGADVAELQRALGVLIADGDFGGITDTWVRAFQGSCGLSKDGVVGPQTWAQVDLLTERLKDGEPPLPKALADQIYSMAQTSELADFAWPDRGVTPPGYLAGMCQSFAVAFRRAEAGDAAAKVMTKELGSPDTDALSWYKAELTAKGLRLDTWDARLRALYILQTGLGPRESSGRYFEGRDLSSSNVESETAEAGVTQTSYNIKAGSSTIPPLLKEFWANPHGLLETFKEGLSPSSQNLDSFGSGDGLRFQFLSRFAPLMHVLITSVGLRTLRKHWGPINNKAVTIKKEADDLLKQVQELIESVA